MKHCFLLIILFFSVSFVTAQTTLQFSATPSEFYSEIDKYLKSGKNSICKKTVEEFVSNAKAGKFEDDHIQSIIGICNNMAERKLQVFPYYENFLASTNAYASKDHLPENLTGFLQIITTHLNTTKRSGNKKFKELSNFGTTLFAENILNKTSTKFWKASNPDFDIIFENDVAYVFYESLELYGMSKNDTITILETKGKFDIMEQRWLGEYGKTNWKKVGLDPEKIYCTFNAYEVDCSKDDYKVDSVKFYNYDIIAAPIWGKLYDRLISQKNIRPYPSFTSYKKDISYETFADNVVFIAGVTQKGNRILGTGDTVSRAILEFYDPETDQLLIKAKSNSFLIKDYNEVISQNASTTIYFEEDSLFHPGISLKFFANEKKLSITRDGESLSKTAISNSFHKMDMFVDVLYWELDKPVIDLKMLTGGSAKTATFESEHYFQQGKIIGYQAVTDHNPISAIKQYAEETGNYSIDANEFAQILNPNYSLETIRRTLFKMVEDGFIFYDNEAEIVTVRPKAFHYVFANRNLVDFDRIKINSTTSDINGQLSLENLDLDLAGVYNINLSDSQNVEIFPANKFVEMKINRDMHFDGTVFGGRLDMYGELYKFNYDGFFIKAPKVDSMMINIPTGKTDKEGNKVLEPVRTFVHNINGKIQIDDPDNKSGKDPFPQYPTLQTFDDAFTYYDRKRLYNKIYSRDKFFFRIDPFIMDSLDNFNPARVIFDGTLVSAGIFPDLSEQVSIQSDKSLGFETFTPSGGLPIYGGKGNYTNKVSLSNKGLKGEGSIKFLASFSKASDIVFWPDSSKAVVDSFLVTKVESGVEFPQVNNRNVTSLWKPYEDDMFVKMGETPFQFREWQANLKGDVHVTANGLNGYGKLDWASARLESNLFDFNANDLHSDTADLEIKTLDFEKVAFKVPNVMADVDFEKQIGDFASNEAEIFTELPYNRFTTSMNEFKWYMDDNFIDFKTPEEGATFASTDKDQDGLNFVGQGGTYDLNTYLLTCKGVDHIMVADAKIQPDSQIVYVEPEANIRKLKNATITCDTLEFYHTITNADIKIKGKLDFKGTGNYTFTNNNFEEFKLFFNDLGVEEGEEKNEFLVYGNAAISDSSNFYLDKNTRFKGKTFLKSNEPFLTFEGYALFELATKSLQPQWFAVNEDIDPDNFQVIVDNPISENKKPLHIGIYYDNTRKNIRPVFLNETSSRDIPIFEINGLLEYDKDTRELVIGTEKKLREFEQRGKLMRIDDAKNKIFADGPLTLGRNMGLFDMQTAGFIKGDLTKNTYEFDMLMSLDFLFEEDLLKIFANDMVNFNEEADYIDYASENFDRLITEFIDEKREKKIKTEMYKSGTFRKPKGLKSTILFTDLKMFFDSTSNAFYSYGPIGIAYAGETAVDLLIEKAYLEIGVKRGSTVMNIYFETEYEDWYFFEYRSKTMRAISSNKAFNNELLSIKPAKKRDENKKLGEYFQYMGGSKSKMRTFKDKFEYRTELYKKNNGIEDDED